MKRWVLLAALILMTTPAAFAHAGGAAIAPADLWHHWNFDPRIWAPLLFAHWLYGRGVMRAWRRAGVGRIVPIWRAICFVCGELALVTALMSPLDPLGETLLTAHMLQHIVLSVIAPPLLVLGLPVRAWTWAFPDRMRRAGASSPVRAVAHLVEALSKPITATLLAVVAMLAWHVPAFFEAALANEAIHTLEHLTFLASSLLAWQAVADRQVSPIAAGAVVLTLFMAGGMLGALMTLTPVVLYDWYGGYAALWGLTPLEDQQLAGLSMWVVAGGVYLVVFAAFAVRVAAPFSPRRSRPSSGIMRASTSSRSMK